MRVRLMHSPYATWQQIRVYLTAALIVGLGAVGCGDESIDPSAPSSSSEQASGYEDDYDDDYDDEYEDGHDDKYDDVEPVRYGKDHDTSFGHNPHCGDVFPELVECKIDPVSEEYYSSYSGMDFADYYDLTRQERWVCDALNFHITRDGKSFDWKTDNTHVNAICVKGGPGANCYDYGEKGATYGAGLNAFDLENGKYYGVSHVTVCVDPKPDVAVEKKALNKYPLSEGDTAKFKIEVTNEGSAIAKNVRLDDELPGTGWDIKKVTLDGYDVTSQGLCEITTDGGTYSTSSHYEPAAETLSCLIPKHKPGQVLKVKIARTVGEADCEAGQISNTALVSADNEPHYDKYQKNNESSASIAVQCGADIAVEKKAVDYKIEAGQTAKFDITVTNLSKVAAKDFKLVDKLPGTGWQISGRLAQFCHTYEYSGYTLLKCETAKFGADSSTVLRVERATTAADCGVIENTVQVSASNDIDYSNNKSTAKIKVMCAANVAVEKSSPYPSIDLNSPIVFDITVKSTGNIAAKNVKLIDKLPGTGWEIASGPAGACDLYEYAYYGFTLLKCTAAKLGPEVSRTLRVKRASTEADCGSVTNTAYVWADNDSDHSDNESSATVAVNCTEADLQVTKTALPAEIPVGYAAKFAITVKNIGTAAAKDVVLTDKLPGKGWSIAYNPGGACKLYEYYDYTLLKCTAAKLGAGDSATVKVARATTAADCGTLKNYAEVSASNDANSSNNKAYAKIEVLCADVSVTKKAIDSAIMLNDPVKFSITVKNEGTLTAKNVVLTDKLPGKGWSITSGPASACHLYEYYDYTLLKCTAAELKPDVHATLTLKRASTEDDCAGITNEATVTADNDTNSANNKSSASITVDCGAIAGDMCTPDYWKQNTDKWCYGLEYKTLGDIFHLEGYAYELGHISLKDALHFQYDYTKLGAVKFLLKQAVAAYLSACSDKVDYPLTKGEIGWKVWVALSMDYKYEILELAYKLQAYNEAAICPASDPYYGY